MHYLIAKAEHTKRPEKQRPVKLGAISKPLVFGSDRFDNGIANMERILLNSKSFQPTAVKGRTHEIFLGGHYKKNLRGPCGKNEWKF